MRVFVTGGTGAIGRFVLPELVAAGHDVTALARSADKARQVEAAGARPVEVSLFDSGALQAAFAGHDAVLNLATAIPPARSMAKPSAWEMNNRIRTEGSAAVVDAAIAAGVGRLVQESITFPYPDCGDAWITEDTPWEPTPALTSVATAEANAARFGEHGDAVVLRFSAFYGPGSEQTDLVLRLARRHIGITLGAGDGYQSNIHLFDAATAAVAALYAPAGTYNVTDDQPLTKREYAEAAAAAVASHVWLRAPGRLVGVLGQSSAALRRSQRVSNRKLRDATDWSPRYANARDGYAEIVKELARA
jgi:nucleoside-diphosphate-sugar epimerase